MWGLRGRSSGNSRSSRRQACPSKIGAQVFVPVYVFIIQACIGGFETIVLLAKANPQVARA